MPEGPTTNDRAQLPVRLDRLVATIEVPVSLADPVRQAFVDVLRPSADPIGHRIEVDEHGRVSMNGRRWDPGADQTVVDQLLYLLLQASLDEDAQRLHLHASFVGLRGRGILVGGVSGSGKSTLIAELVADGFDYFTDERVAVDTDLSLAPLPKPISIAHGTGGPLESIAARALSAGFASHRLWHLPASMLRPGSVGAQVPPLAAIVLVEYRAGAALETAALHPITVARVLLTDCLDADRFGAHGPLLVARLCASVPCVSAIHGGGESVRAFVRTVVGDAGHPEAYEVEAIDGGSRPAWKGAVRFGPASVVGRARGIHGALVADRALVRTAQGAVVELDETLTAWFLLLDGSTSLRTIVREVAEETGTDGASLETNAVAIVEHLASLGVAA